MKCYQCQGAKNPQATMLPPINFHLLAQPKKVNKIFYVTSKNDDLDLFLNRQEVRRDQLKKEVK